MNNLPRITNPKKPTFRNAIAAAKLAGLTEDLQLSSVQFQTSVSVLFVG